MLQRQRAKSMPNKTLTGTWGIAALALVLAGSATPAYAGFEWIAPSDGGTYQSPSVNAYVPPFPSSSPSSFAATTAPEVISPVIITGQPDQTVPAPAVAVPVPSIPTTAPITNKNTGKTSLATATISMAPQTSLSSSSSTVQGFASQIPLALALRQVLPADYNFSIDQDVDMNTLVSYRGGKPWRETLQSMLSPAGLVGNEQGTTITIGRIGDGGASSVISSAPASGSVSPVLAENAAVTSPAPALVSALPPIPPARSVGQSSYLVPPVTTDEPAFSPGPANGGWNAERGDTLRKVLTDWCRRSGVELQWQAEYDYPIDASAHFNSSFEDAVRQILAGFDGARPQPIGELHTNPSAGQMVLVVSARGNSYTN